VPSSADQGPKAEQVLAALSAIQDPDLGAIPLDKAIREEADNGAPVVASKPETAGAQALQKVASTVAARIAVQSFRQLPVINLR
jgi:MinD-like ATPase involved in chromosome partitioning or flagellar assembly